MADKHHSKQVSLAAAAAAAKSLQLCPILCDSRDGSPPGSPVPGILQARTLERVAIAFSNTWKWKVKVKSLSRVRLLATPWTAVGNTEKVNNDTVPFPTWSPQCLNGFRCDLGKSCSWVVQKPSMCPVHCGYKGDVGPAPLRWLCPQSPSLPSSKQD